MLYLTVQDAIALALENNIDLEVARYNPILAEWQVERSQAGGALPGVPSSAAQAGNVASGQGVAGSQAAAGVNTGAMEETDPQPPTRPSRRSAPSARPWIPSSRRIPCSAIRRPLKPMPRRRSCRC